MSLHIEDWGFDAGPGGSLRIAGIPAEELAGRFGTPLHVVDLAALRANARRFRASFEEAYPGPTRVHYALKCNNTPAVVGEVLREGLRPEVGTPYEWTLVERLGVPAPDVIVNGPHKGPLIETAARAGAGAIVADGPADLAAIASAAEVVGCDVTVLLRVNPDCVPHGMNGATATGSRKLSVFGFDLRSGELEVALRSLAQSGPGFPGGRRLRYGGLHCHVGTGIARPRDYEPAVERLVACIDLARRLGLPTSLLDMGGGFGVPTSRELRTGEFLAYQALGRLPRAPDAARFPAVERFAAAVSRAVARACGRRGLELPVLLLEPGRAVVSQAGTLLIRVGSIKSRPGAGTWAVTDGGAGTVAFPLYYEYHEIFACRAPRADRSRRYTIVGPACFSADWISRNKPMPPLRAGDVLAVCDAGAYFTVQESNFGFPRPAIVGVEAGAARILRRRETFDDMVGRDEGWENGHVA